METLKDTVQSKTAVPTAQVYVCNLLLLKHFSDALLFDFSTASLYFTLSDLV